VEYYTRTFSEYEEAVLEVLFKRPTGPPISEEEDIIRVDLTQLDIPDTDTHVATPPLGSYGNRVKLDWNRLKDFKDDYDEILLDPNRKVTIKD